MPFDVVKYQEIGADIDKSLIKNDIKSQPMIVAATKQQGESDIIQAINAGITHFGENRVQEALEKWPHIKESYPDMTLQMIGGLQSNKAEAAVDLFDEILTVDRESLAKALKKAMDKLIVDCPEGAKDDTKQLPKAAVLRAEGSEMRHIHCDEYGLKKTKRPNLMIQVNIGEEPQKSGVLPSDADDFIHYCKDELELPIVGLMCVPPADAYPAPYFALLATIAKRHNLQRLSMGMSRDYGAAIRMGATEVRLGTVLFGKRAV